jgi:hypothetical protein
LIAKGLEVTRKLWGERAGGQELPAQKLDPEFFGLVTQPEAVCLMLGKMGDLVA